MIEQRVNSVGRFVVLAAAFSAVAACADAPQQITGPKAATAIRRSLGDDGGVVKICKTSEKAGDFTFNITKTGGGDGVSELVAQTTLSILRDSSDACRDIWFPANPASWTSDATITVSEVVPPGMTLSAVQIFKNGALADVLSGTDRGSVTTGYGETGSVEFTNIVTPPDSTATGCSESYWDDDDRPADWSATGYDRTLKLKWLFPRTARMELNGHRAGDYTLGEALALGGGSGPTADEQLLLRSAAAAVLNASHRRVRYPYARAGIVRDVNTVLTSGDLARIRLLAARLHHANHGKCALGDDDGDEHGHRGKHHHDHTRDHGRDSSDRGGRIGGFLSGLAGLLSGGN